jgi:hypothetical protein
VLRPLEDDSVRDAAAILRRERVESVAVCLLHAYVNDEHEQRVGEILAEELPGIPISLSSEVAPEFREYLRAEQLVYAGQISLAQAAFFGIGAYTSGILTTKFGVNPWLAIPAGMIVCAAVAWIVGVPALRLKGHYLAMATLGFGVIVNIIFAEEINWTGGPSGSLGVLISRADIGWLPGWACRRFIYNAWFTSPASRSSNMAWPTKTGPFSGRITITRKKLLVPANCSAPSWGLTFRLREHGIRAIAWKPPVLPTSLPGRNVCAPGLPPM